MPARTASFLDPMLDATKPRHLRQVEHLPRLRLHDRPIRQIPPAALAAINRMRDRLIRILTALKMMTRMPGLTTRLAPRPASQAPLLTRRRLGIPIRRRRLGRVARVLIQPRLELRNHRIALHEPNLKLGDLRAEHLDQGIQLSSTRLKRRTRSLCIRACSQHARKIPCAPPRSCPPTPSPLRRTKPPGPEQLRSAMAFLQGRRNLRGMERCPVRAIKEMNRTPKSRSDVRQGRTRDQPSGREPQGDGVPIVVVGATTHQGDGRAVRRAKGHRWLDIEEPRGMRNAERRNGPRCPPRTRQARPG